ncbi:MAG: SDR family oxidoreductase [Arenicellales bacterium]|jgi:NAD(P)-dependent dehydrogenase (short-subunit alcohol dehydrogenase family)|nr:SDR family oxidoreductase [Arenicellales bacterium]|tara:strand:- start:11532 stop:12329 length:798 start_codon:yes stop_codon:yes gene_type:complete
MSFGLDEKVALVFGAGSCGPGWGNGKAAAVAYARAGASVVAVDLDIERADETRSIIEQEGGNCLALKADVTKAGEVEEAVARTVSAHGRIDILHSNVGIGDMGNPIDLAEDDWDHVIDTNLKSIFLICKHVLPIMLEQESGVITCISSVASLGVRSPELIGYNVTKAALNHFTRTIAIGYAARGVRANAILPGLMNTPMIYHVKGHVAQYGGEEAMVSSRDAQSPTGKMGDAWDVAHAAVFLASDEANYINGVILPVDGGLSCGI